MKLRNYQKSQVEAIEAAWDSGARNVLTVLPTGGGKTVEVGDIVSRERGAACVIAHRQELVSQISLALAMYGARHNIIAPRNVVRFIVNLHIEETGRSYFAPEAGAAVAGVDTLIGTRRQQELSHWFPRVTLWVQDEAHHVLRANKWGRAASLFPNARGLGVTATPIRADGKGLGRDAEGLFDSLVSGPSLRQLISEGHLTDYRIYAPPSDLDLSDVNVTAAGDYSPVKLRAAAKRSHIVGDVVTHYLRLASGKLGITFSTDVETATATAAKFNAAGVPAEVVSAKTPDRLRVEILRRFRRRELLQLVNVDLFGEGFDLPAIECVSMARPTESFALFSQQFGRALRPMPGKEQAIIIDHVGNVERHAVARDCPYTGRLVIDPCYRDWSLEGRQRRGASKPADAIPVRACPQCTAIYERVYPDCPFCGYRPKPVARSSPELVDGDLTELDPAALHRILSERSRIDGAPIALETDNPAVQGSYFKKHEARKAAQGKLRESIAWWGAYQRAHGRSDVESYRRFFFKFGIDVGSAQILGAREAEELAGRIDTARNEV